MVNFGNSQSPSSKKGFVKLFNGKNLDGWYLKIRSGDVELAKKV
jgi:translation initiation factor RLI1